MSEATLVFKCPDKFEPQSFIQHIIDTIEFEKDAYNMTHQYKIRFTWEFDWLPPTDELEPLEALEDCKT